MLSISEQQQASSAAHPNPSPSEDGYSPKNNHSSSSTTSPFSSQPTSPEDDRQAGSSSGQVKERPLKTVLFSSLKPKKAGKSSAGEGLPFRHHEKSAWESKYEARRWNDGLLEDMWGVAEKAKKIWDKENVLSHKPGSSVSSIRTPVFACNTKIAEAVPPRGVVDAPPIFYTAKPGREEVLQICRDSSPYVRMSDAFFRRMHSQNEECKWRAIYIDDPYGEPAVKTIQAPQKRVAELSVSQVLEKMLPNPSIFTVATYLSKRHKISSIESGQVDPEMSYADMSLQARVIQYAESKAVLECAMAKGNYAPKGSYPVFEPRTPSEQNVVHEAYAAAEAKAKLSNGKSSTGEDKLSSHELMQFVLLRKWELRRDLERLEALHRNVSEAKRRISQLPWTASSSIIRSTREGREARCYRTSNKTEITRQMGTQPSDALVDVLPAPGTEQYYQSTFDNAVLDPHRSMADMAHQHHAFSCSGDGGASVRRADIQKPTLVYGDCQYLSGGLTTQRVEEAQAELAAAEDAFRRHQAMRHGEISSTQIVQDLGPAEGAEGAGREWPWRKVVWRPKGRRV